MKKIAWFKHPNDLSSDKGYPYPSTTKEEEDTERICISSIELQFIRKKWHRNCTGFARQLTSN